MRSALRRSSKGLELIGADLQVAGLHRPFLDCAAGQLAPAYDRLDAGQHLLGVAGLADPVVGPEAQPAHPLGHGGATRADDQPHAGSRSGQALHEVPCLTPEQGEVHDEGVDAHGGQLLDSGRGLEAEMGPSQAVHPVHENAHEPRVGVEHRDPDRSVIGRVHVVRAYATLAPKSGRFTAFSQAGHAHITGFLPASWDRLHHMEAATNGYLSAGEVEVRPSRVHGGRRRASR
ncbi:MAG: hypothetical protein WKF40_08075 [Thermoleophilaceae bacterium]